MPPASGFKSPIREAKLSHFAKSPSHPALAVTSPKFVDHEIASTPINDIKSRLNNMRKQTIQRQESRRATVGFALLATPTSKPKVIHSASFTSLNPTTRHFHKKPPIATLLVSPHGRNGTASLKQSLVGAPMPTVSLHDILPQRPEDNLNDPGYSPIEDESAVYCSEEDRMNVNDNKIPVTPRIGNHSAPAQQTMMKPPHLPKSPNLADINHTYPYLLEERASASLPAVKDLTQLSKPPATPSFTGLKNLFAQREVPPTPAMEGIAQMYALHEVDAEEESEELLSSIVVSVRSPSSKASARSRPSKLASSTSSRSHGTQANDQAMAGEEPVRRTTARRGKMVESEPVEEPVPALEPKSKPSRRRRIAEPSLIHNPEPEVELGNHSSTSTQLRGSDTQESVSTVIQVKSVSTSRSSRSTRSHRIEESEPVPTPASTRSRSTASRSARKAEFSAVEEETEKAKATATGKEAIGESDERPISPVSKASTRADRGKKALATSTSAEANSAPSRRVRSEVTKKEKEEAADEVVVKEEVKRNAQKEKKVEQGSAVVGTRTTRSRK